MTSPRIINSFTGAANHKGWLALHFITRIFIGALLPAGLLGTAAFAETEVWTPPEVAVDQAVSVVFDQTPPEPAVIETPDPANTLPIDLSYAHEGGGSPVETARLWIRRGEDGAWRQTELSSSEAEGLLALDELEADGRYYVAFQTTDKAGNQSPEPEGTAHPLALYDTTPPELTLQGEAEIAQFVGEEYADPGATAHDELDGNITDRIEVTDLVNTSAPGLYEVRYTISDSAGNRAPEAVRTVEVQDTHRLEVVQPDQGSIDVTPSPNAGERYVNGTAITLTYSSGGSDEYQIQGWSDAQSLDGDPNTAETVMDQDRMVSVTFSELGGFVRVDVAPSEAEWVVTDADGAEHEGQGAALLEDIPAGSASIEFRALDGYQTPDAQSGQVEDGETLTFSAQYEEERQAGAVQVNATPSEARWVVIDTDGAEHEGQGAALLQDIPAGSADIEFLALDGYDTPGSQSGQVEDSETLTFSAEYEEKSTYRLAGENDVEGTPGETVDVPIRLNPSADVIGYRLEAAWDSELAEFESLSRGSLTTDWDAPVVSSSDGSVTVTADGDVLNDDGGELAILRLRIKESVEEDEEMPIQLTNAELDTDVQIGITSAGGSELKTVDGRVLIAAERFLWGDVTGQEDVTVDDANELLQYGTGRIEQLSIAEQAGESDYIGGANVSGAEPPVLGAMDAALILRYVQGHIDRFPADLDGDGYGPEAEGDGDESTLADRMVAYLDETSTRTLYVTDISAATPGAEIQVPLRLDNATRVLGYYVDLEFDGSHLEYVKVEKGGVTGDNWVEPVVNASEGRLRLAAAGAEDRSEGGDLAVLTFRVRTSTPEDTITEFAVAEAKLNGGAIPVEVIEAPASPQLTAIEPAQGPAQGGSVVEISGSNFSEVDEVHFGDTPAEWFEVDAVESVITAVVPAGEGTVGVHVSALGNGDTLQDAFEYRHTRVRLSLVPEDQVELGEMLEIPLYMERDNNRSVRTLEFTLNFKPGMFAAYSANGIEELVQQSDQEAAIEYELEEPGKLRVRMEASHARGFDSGHIATCYLFAKGFEPDRPSLLYISGIEASNQ
ncbi:MAG: cohesin domain-containing protein [Candidatus Hydrogenedentota bacterium]